MREDKFVLFQTFRGATFSLTARTSTFLIVNLQHRAASWFVVCQRQRPLWQGSCSHVDINCHGQQWRLVNESGRCQCNEGLFWTWQEETLIRKNAPERSKSTPRCPGPQSHFIFFHRLCKTYEEMSCNAKPYIGQCEHSVLRDRKLKEMTATRTAAGLRYFTQS